MEVLDEDYWVECKLSFRVHVFDYQSLTLESRKTVEDFKQLPAVELMLVSLRLI
jgi:hypothetical protein